MPAFVGLTIFLFADGLLWAARRERASTEQRGAHSVRVF
jgi:hypothetical protein